MFRYPISFDHFDNISNNMTYSCLRSQLSGITVTEEKDAESSFLSLPFFDSLQEIHFELIETF